MKVLFIAPLPPPISGHSLASEVLLRELDKRYRVEVVNIKKDSLVKGIDSFKRICEILKIFVEVYRKRRAADLVYFTISESVAGNLKDIVIYMLCYGLLPRLYVHLHGGGMKKELFEPHRVLRAINRAFLSKVAGAIVTGPSHVDIFAGMIAPEKIHTAANFAEDYLVSSVAEIAARFSEMNPIRVLYISHMIRRKGYDLLVRAYLELADDVKEKFRVDFVGGFDCENNQNQFLDSIKGEPRIQYHGVITDRERKKRLFQRTHVLCLPTSFLEGQPIAILEAYAAGCAVVTTGQPGIHDIFAHEVNGYEVSKVTSSAIADVLQRIAANPEQLLGIAMKNRDLADREYRTSSYVKRVMSIISPPSLSKQQNSRNS